MNNGTAGFDLKKIKDYADWKLLLFLLLFLNVKLAVKIPAIAIIYLLQFDFNFGFKLKNSRLPLFYLAMIAIPIIDLFFYKGYSVQNYLIAFSIGVGFWLLCILAIHQVKLSVEKNDTEIIHRTLLLFFAINAIASFLNYAYIVFETGTINPYSFQGEHQKYFISTGDFIKGITFDTSTTNAVISIFGLLYFFIRKNALMMLVCMITLLLTGSNFNNLILLPILLVFFILKSTRDQKSLIVICLAFFVVFMARVSTQNNNYVAQTFKNLIYKNQINTPNPIWYDAPVVKKTVTYPPAEQNRIQIAQHYLDSIYILNEKYMHRQVYHAAKPLLISDQGRIYIPKPNLNLSPYQPIPTTPPEQLKLVNFIDTHKGNLPLSLQSNIKFAYPGKIMGAIQTASFFKQHPAKILTGDGIGNFSSKLAFRTSGIGVTGGYPEKYVYIDPDFELNHLDLYLKFFSKKSDYHSLTNSPYSVYDQLLSEYGILGLLAFVIFYISFFARHYRLLTYGIPILAFIMIVFFLDYWFEQLSVMVLFELMLFLNIKEGQNKNLVTV